MTGLCATVDQWREANAHRLIDCRLGCRITLKPVMRIRQEPAGTSSTSTATWSLASGSTQNLSTVSCLSRVRISCLTSTFKP